MFSTNPNKLHFISKNKNGISKAIYPSGIIGYEGEIFNSKPHGYGKTYYSNGLLAYEGEFSNGKPHGHGIEYYEYGIIKCEGLFVMGKPLTSNKFYDTNGKLYTDNKDVIII
jgi:antitoxin component YwqK of YwqJK toxin-antitoxin module